MGRRSEVSAGILAYRRTGGLELLLAHPGGPFWKNRDDGAWTIPKGLIGGDEPLAGARREFNEETGLTATGPFLTLTPVRLKSGKTVHAFAVEADYEVAEFSSNSFELEWPPRSGRRQSFPEIDRLAYFDPAEARRKILPAQRPLIDELERRLADREAAR